jgi:hypothetical protein
MVSIVRDGGVPGALGPGLRGVRAPESPHRAGPIGQAAHMASGRVYANFGEFFFYVFG